MMKNGTAVVVVRFVTPHGKTHTVDVDLR